MTAIIGFKFSLIIGIISGVAYAIPIIGMLIAEIIAVPMSAPQGLWMIVWVQVIMFGMARISDNVLVPKIMGQSVGVSPIGAMFAVFAGGELFGIPGLDLGHSGRRADQNPVALLRGAMDCDAVGEELSRVTLRCASPF